MAMLESPVLVLNAGSSSLKAAVVAADGAILWRGQRPWHPELGPPLERHPQHPLDPGVRDQLVDLLREWLAPPLASWLDPGGSGQALAAHRVVHGGERFTAPTQVGPELLAELRALLPLAPLHNGPALQLMEALARWQPQLDQWACFDTAFHASLPPAARTYAIPRSWRDAGLRRFGFHGLNHQHVAETVALLRPQTRRLISCHLGAGCSLCAVRDGRSIATTMGFTPLEGLVMASRSGSVDPGVLLHQLRHGVDVDALEEALQSQSGLLGLSELSGDMQHLRQARLAGHAGAALAIDVFRDRLLQGIGAMAASLGGVDAIALTGGIGEHDEALRLELAEALGWLGPVPLLVIPADEEGLIARICRDAAARLDAAG